MSIPNGQPRGKSRAAHDIPYPVRTEVEYRLKQGKRVVEVGRTHTVSLSVREVVLDSKQQMAGGMEIELILPWPGPLGKLGRLVLRVQGRTVAGVGRHTTVQIGQYDFETSLETHRPAQRKPLKTMGETSLPHAAPFAS